MKKLMFILCAVVTACAANAAYVDWQYSISDAKTGGTGIDYADGYTAYFMTAAAYNTLTAKESWGASDLAAASLDSSELIVGSGSKKLNVWATGNDGKTSIRQVAADTGNYYVILGTADGYDVVLENVSVTAYSDPAGAGTGLTPDVTIGPGAAVDAATLSFADFPTGPTPGPTPGIPEPTSGLLLVVGGAMLALRRKQK